MEAILHHLGLSVRYRFQGMRYVGWGRFSPIELITGVGNVGIIYGTIGYIGIAEKKMETAIPSLLARRLLRRCTPRRRLLQPSQLWLVF